MKVKRPHAHDSVRLSPILQHYKNKKWLQFLFIVKAAVLKQQISKFYPQILSTEASDHIYFSQRPFINVKAISIAILDFGNFKFLTIGTLNRVELRPHAKFWRNRAKRG